MRKITILAIVCLATACGDVSGEVWFVPGWRTGFSGRDGCVRILKDIYPGQNIRVCSWDSLQPWQTAVRNSREFTGKLNQEIMRLDHSRRRDIILVGHSIGGEIVLEILSRLAGHKMSIHSAAILGGAVPCDDPRIVQALHAVRFHISNVYDPGDWVLKYLYPLGNSRVVPLGLAGWAGSDPRFLEISASGKKAVSIIIMRICIWKCWQKCRTSTPNCWKLHILNHLNSGDLPTLCFGMILKPLAVGNCRPIMMGQAGSLIRTECVVQQGPGRKWKIFSPGSKLN